MSARLAALLGLGLLLTGSITLAHQSGVGLSPAATHAPLGRLASGSSAGMNATNGSATVVGSLVSATTDVLYLNNTDPTQAVYAKLVLTSSTGTSGITALSVGIDNGSADTAQVSGTAGSLTQTAGSYARLEPGSANRLYVTQTVSVLFTASTLNMDLVVADDLAESATVTSKVRLSIT